MKRYRIDFCESGWYFTPVGRIYVDAESEDEARKVAQETAAAYGASTYELNTIQHTF